MMNRLKYKYLSMAIVSAPLLIANMSCHEDLLYDSNGRPVEGLPATIEVELKLSDMAELSRSFVDEEGANYCDDLWVGIYRESDGKCIYNHTYDNLSEYLEQVDEANYLGKLVIETESGRSRIVAVSNVNSCDAMASPTANETDAIGLDAQLEAADTWSKFTNICAMRSDPEDVYWFTYDLTMSGYYSDDKTDYKRKSNDIPTVDIVEGENDLHGAINLRRLISYNKFDIAVGENVNMELVSWQVFNNPYFCYVMESESNAGDDSGSATAYNPGQLSNVFKKEDDGTYSFEFYQYENKHTACDYSGNSSDWVGIRKNVTTSEMYNDREREYKDTYSDIDRTQSAEDGDYHKNTGTYKSLVNNTSDTESMANNNASYVVLTAYISYYIEDDDAGYNRAHPDEATPEAKGAHTKQIYRTAKAVYTIHLGYCEGKDSSDNPTYTTATDFNCRRNSKYTYDVEILGVSKIVVEAKKQGEIQSSVEGSVFDAYGEFVELDSHYGAFNISLTNEERNSLKYHVTAPYNGVTHYFYSENGYDPTWESNQLFTWIKVKPTENEKTLAVYNDGSGSNDLWSLNDLCDVEGHPHHAGSTDKGDTTEQWYTIFIDEYVYHDGESGNDSDGYNETTWGTYTNQDDRKVELLKNDDRSEDDESDYMFCKYAFSQKSIQTYYQSTDPDETGMGVEHVNESYGLNFRWNDNITTANCSEENGRYNLYYAKNQTSLTWANTVAETVPDDIPYGICAATGNYHNAKSYPVPQLKPIADYSTQCKWDPSPDDMNFYYVNSACMNRNRDLNGNGVIDKSEMKWYLPTYDQYVEIMIGLSGLVSPLIDWNMYSERRYVGSSSTQGREDLHFATSDRDVLWAEEGFSITEKTLYSNPSLTNGDYGNYPYDIRCVRNLGSNPGNTPTSASEIQEAYERRSSNQYVFDAEYYTDECIRPFTSSFIGPNFINSEGNKPYRHFEMARNYCTDFTVNGELTAGSNGVVTQLTNTDYASRTNKWYHVLQNNSICRLYTQEEGGSDLGTWRMPNIKEVAMMTTEGVFDGEGSHIGSSTYEYFINFDGNECPYCFFGRLGGGRKIARSIFKGNNTSLYTKVRCVRDIKK